MLCSTQSLRAASCLRKASTAAAGHAVSARSAQRVLRPRARSGRPFSTTPRSADEGSLIDWTTFFKLRTERRRWQLGGSVVTGGVGFVMGAQVVTMTDMDWLLTQVPLDPFISLGLIAFSCGALGWLTGPAIGTRIFNLRKSSYRDAMAQKEKEFYMRIKKYRVDPSNSSMANPVPDYYGEKINSVGGYRQWLKDQRAFNMKRKNYV